MNKLFAGAAVVALVVSLASCSDSDSDDDNQSSSNDYCSLLSKSRDFSALTMNSLSDEGFDKARASVKDLQDAASGTVADDWAALGNSLDSLKAAADKAGISVSDVSSLLSGNVPQGLSPDEAQQVVTTIQQVMSDPKLATAADDIATDAKKTCHVDLTQ
jgi:hypothetical protein